MFSLPLILLASLFDFLINLFTPQGDRANGLGALLLLALLGIFSVIAVMAVGNFLFNL